MTRLDYLRACTPVHARLFASAPHSLIYLCISPQKIASTDKAAFQKLVPFIQECLEHSVPNIQLLACDAVVAAKDMLAKEVAVKTFR